MVAELAAIVGDERVTTRAAHLERARITGEAILVSPGSAAEVAELVGRCAASGAPVIPVGSGTRAQPGGAGRRLRVFVDLARMSHVLNLDETSLTVHAQAGLRATDLEKILAVRGLSLGDYPPAALSSSVGGLLAVRTPGKASTRHGFIEDAVLGLSAVLADGRTVHTRVAPRRATGPDLARALCGSEGTLGIITSAVLRIHRAPEARFLAAFALPRFADTLAAVRLALREEAAPAAMRAYDGLEARAHFGDDCCEVDQAVLVIATAGPTDLAACDRDLVASAVAVCGGEPLAEKLAETWWARRTGAIRLEVPLPHLQVSATPGRQAEVYDAVSRAAAEVDLGVRAHASRFDLDGGVLFFTAVDGDNRPVDDAAIDRHIEVLENAAAGAGGVLLGSWNPTLEPYFEKLRDELDPERILNPWVP
jgi:alkyldihydroxyacetonephosphate synthase